MGIQGLLPVLKPITNTVHVSKYRGQKVAVDAYCWLHKAAYCCAEEICEGKFTDKHVVYCMQKVQMLQQCGVQPVIVFDGGRLPMKATEEGSRSRARQENKNKAAAHVKAGNKQAAYECYQRAVDISPATARDFVMYLISSVAAKAFIQVDIALQALKAANVDFIVAPFEADAQMAYLAVNGLVHSVITEDSDLLPYGCPRVLFKMDKAGEGQEVVAADLAQNRDPSFIGFTHQMFLEMCIFAGCDFLKALPGIGMKKAHQHVKRLKTHRKVCKSLRFSGVSVPRDYEQGFQRALWTFQHQRVWCPDQRQLVHLRPLPPGGLSAVDAVVGALAEADSAFDFLGPIQPDTVMQQVAEGDLDPITLKPFPSPIVQIPPHLNPQMARTPTPQSHTLEGRSSFGARRQWRPQRRSSEGKLSGGKRPLTLPVQANGITSYFPALPTKGEALRQFSAPRPAALSHLNCTPSYKHSSAARSSNVADPGDNDFQPSTSGHFSTATSPAGKASRHLSGCGSQPELPQHAFATFAAGHHDPGRPSSQLANSRHASPCPDQALTQPGSGHQPAALLHGSHAPPVRTRKLSPLSDQTPGSEGNSKQSPSLDQEMLSSRVSSSKPSLPPEQDSDQLRSRGPSHVLLDKESADRGSSRNNSSSLKVSVLGTSPLLNVPLPEEPALHSSTSLSAIGRSPCADRQGCLSAHSSMDISVDDATVEGAALDRTTAGVSAEMEVAASRPSSASQPRTKSILPLIGNSSASVALKPSSARIDSPFKAASRSFASEQGTSSDQSVKRKVSAYFGGQPKRHKSAEAEESPAHASSHGLLGGLVSKLKSQQSVDNSTSLQHDSIDIYLEDAEDKPDLDRVGQDSVQSDSELLDVEHDDAAASLHLEPIAGLEHIQPFASIANVAVGRVTAASLKKFGMADAQKPAKHRHAAAGQVLQPFAPPRRRNASQEVQHHQDDDECRQATRTAAPVLQNFACLVGSNK